MSAQSRDLPTLTLKQASELVRRKDVSPVELTEACLARIERHDRAINAFISVTREQALATADPLDPTSVDAPVPDYSRAARMDTRKLRVGVARTPFFENLNPEVAKAVEAAIDVVRTLTAGVRDVDVPAAGNVATVWNPEIYAYHLPWITKTPELYQAATRNLIEGAGKASAATYAQARREVDVVRREIKKVFATVDVLITPTQRGVAQPIAPPQPPPTGGGAEGRRQRRAAADSSTPPRSTSMACPRSPCRAGSRPRACRSGCRSAATTSQNRRCSQSPTNTSRRPSGTGGARRCRETERRRPCPRARGCS